MGTPEGSPSPPALRLRRAKPSSATANLIAVLRRVRRRLRLRRALDATVLGGTVALGVAAAVVILQVVRPGEAGLGAGPAVPGGHLPARLGLLLLAAVTGGLLGAIVSLARIGRSELTAAATAVDRWLGQASAGVQGDRARVALALGDSDSPFARAAVADAAERASAVPLRAAVPLRRPRRLGALAVAAACGVLAAVAPVLAPTASTRQATGVPGVNGPRGSRAAAISEVQAIGRAARARGDDDLAALADELHRWLARSAEDTPASSGELAAIAARARRSAEEGAEAAAVLARVAAALEKTEAARALGQAFARMDAQGIAAAARAAATAPGSSGALAEALSRAAAAARTEADNAGPRRLDGLEPEAVGQPRAGKQAAGGGAPPATPERQLRRLERDLRETADACAVDPERCGQELSARSDDLAAPAREAAGAGAREQLARTAERLGGGGEPAGGEPGRRAGGVSQGADGQGQLGNSVGKRAGKSVGQSAGQRALGQGAVGQGAVGRSGAGERGGQDSAGATGGASTGAASASDDPAAAAAREAFERAARGEAANGSGPGGGGTGAGTGSGEASGPGAEGQAPGSAAAGPRVELSIPEGAGPTRAEAIRTGAGRGFAQPGYAPVFRDYQAAMEDGLEQTDIPAERRQLVRRYFELIRPR